VDNRLALQLIRAINDDSLPMQVEWLSPIIVAMLAAAVASDPRAQERVRERISLSPEQQAYSLTCGLRAVIEGRYQMPSLTGLQGLTYTRLTRLASPHEVDACNAVINDLFHEQFGKNGEEFIRLLSKVVGELHDNVASHARGVGFSIAQRYRRAGGDVIQFAIVDCGIGMLRNVKKVEPSVTTDERAIDWCLQRGNTTAVSEVDDWAQRLPEDSLFSPYPETVRTVAGENHHQGLGLWHLREIVRAAGGSFWVASGAGQCRYLVGAAGLSYAFVEPRWQGVAIEVELPVPQVSLAATARRAALEGLAERLGL